MKSQVMFYHRVNKFVKILLVVIILFLLSSCGSSNSRNTDTILNSDHYTLSSKEIKKIKIFYPVFENEAINELVNEDIDEFFYYFDDDQKENTSLTIDCDVHFSEKYISITYSGLAYYKDAAYPYRCMYASNIQYDPIKRINLSDLYVIDDDFIQNIITYATEQLSNSEIGKTGYVFEEHFSQNKLKDMLLSEIDPDEFIWHIDDDSIYINITVIHVLGDYLEINIPINSLENFKK